MPTRLMATFRPQRDLDGGNYEDIDGGKVQFDATAAFLGLSLTDIHDYEEHDYSSDALADDLDERKAHDGPFEVDCDVGEWLKGNGVPDRWQMTQADLNRLRAEYGVEPES